VDHAKSTHGWRVRANRLVFAGPDTVDNGLALCALHRKLFDRGALGLDDDLRIKVSTEFSTRTGVGRLLYDLHGRPLRPRPGTTMPAAE